jgi:small subunit ribosomal protein S9
LSDEERKDAEQPEAEEPQAEEPQADVPAAEEPPSEEPQADEPAVEEPQTEEPPAEEPPIEEPQAEEAEPAEPKAEQPEALEEAEQPEAPEEAEQPEAPEQAEQPEAPQQAEQPEPAREPSKGEDGPPPGAELEPIAIEADRELTAEERARLEAEAEERARREAEATAERPEEPAPRRTAPTELSAETRIQATGKRKSSIARVIVSAGDGGFEVNSRSLDEYFPRPHHRAVARQPLAVSGFEGNVNVRVRVQGGGISGQAGAIRHGVARALTEIDPELRRDLKRRGLLTRDARRKERRKAGLKKARKRPQFSKR